MILESLQIARRDFEARTGWIFKLEGACKGETCVSLPSAPGDQIDVRSFSAQLNMPLVRHQDDALWCLGPEWGGRALLTARAPALVLPDLEDRPFSLDSLRGSKALIVAWASW